jgi:hypothetical protein
MSTRPIAMIACLALSGCGEEHRAEFGPDLDGLAADYLFVELSMGLHDDNHVDAYYGPTDILRAAEEAELSLEEIGERAAQLAAQVSNWPGNRSDRMQLARIQGLNQRLTALATRIAINEGRTFAFDEESKRLFGVTAPDHDAAHFEAILREIDELVPGSGDLSSRVSAFQDQFVIPLDRLPEVFDAAIAECRRRTLEHIELPDDESFSIEYVTDKPWSGYNWYQGDSQSLIQINTDLPIFINRAVDLGCHEGYPGHHTFNVLLEKNLVDGEGWVEFTLYPLFSAASLIAEGSANYGIQLAFPDDERLLFERRQLFPLAGLNPDRAERYYELVTLLQKLDYAGNEAARDYLNGTIKRDEAVQWLVNYTLVSPERANQRVDFFDTYRSYVINYNLGKDLVRAYVERDTATPDQRWRRFGRMLSTPMLPSDLLE